MHYLVSGDSDGLQCLQIVKVPKLCKPTGPVRILDSFMIRVPATSGLEAEALAVIHALQALALALRINRALTQLRLHGNYVGVQGAQAHEIASNTSQDGQV